MTAKRKRIFITCRHVTDAKHPDQGFQLVRQCHSDAHRIAGQFITRKTRTVMVANGMGHGVVQPVVLGVVGAHDALQLGELAHHVGEQIGLGQTRSQLGLCGQLGTTELLPDRLGNGAGTRHALALRAQLVVVHHFGQAFNARLQRFFAVLVEKEFGIGQARAHHPLVALNHGRRVIGADVAHHQKLMGQLACGIEQREVFLVGLHGQNQTLLRHLKELFFKFANQYIRTFHQSRDFIKQRLVFDGVHAATHFGGSRLKLTLNLGATLGKTGDDGTVAFKHFGVVIGMREHQR